jgi:excisionase family DNA binding protein
VDHIEPDDLLTTAQAAERVGIDSSRIRRYIKAGRLPATLYGKTWLIRASDLPLIAERKPGRPRKAAP